MRLSGNPKRLLYALKLRAPSPTAAAAKAATAAMGPWTLRWLDLLRHGCSDRPPGQKGSFPIRALEGRCLCRHPREGATALRVHQPARPQSKAALLRNRPRAPALCLRNNTKSPGGTLCQPFLQNLEGRVRMPQAGSYSRRGAAACSCLHLAEPSSRGGATPPRMLCRCLRNHGSGRQP